MTWNKDAFFNGLYDGYSRVDDAVPFPTLPSDPPDARGLFQVQPPAVSENVARMMQLLGLQFRGALADPPRPLTAREKLANRVGSAGWHLGTTISRLGRFIDVTGSRVIDAGDSFAEWIADR
jgi:hypothetical protein